MNKKQINTLAIVVIIAVVAVISYFIYKDIAAVKKLKLRAAELQKKVAAGLASEAEKQELNKVMYELSKHKTALYPTSKGETVYSNATQQIALLARKSGYNQYNTPNPGAIHLEPVAYPMVNEGDLLGTIIDKDENYIYIKFTPTSNFGGVNYFRTYPSQLKK